MKKTRIVIEMTDTGEHVATSIGVLDCSKPIPVPVPKKVLADYFMDSFVAGRIYIGVTEAVRAVRAEMEDDTEEEGRKSCDGECGSCSTGADLVEKLKNSLETGEQERDPEYVRNMRRFISELSEMPCPEPPLSFNGMPKQVWEGMYRSCAASFCSAAVKKLGREFIGLVNEETFPEIKTEAAALLAKDVYLKAEQVGNALASVTGEGQDMKKRVGGRIKEQIEDMFAFLDIKSWTENILPVLTGSDKTHTA